ncbi:hypothetical protein V3470_00015 [Flavobacterium oreochromis]|uniref:Uncharacterized protein n=1 Tax=Flavobacterium oreochromis TaxID=2906078 RepID=A0ABW8P6R2_9FLAO
MINLKCIKLFRNIKWTSPYIIIQNNLYLNSKDGVYFFNFSNLDFEKIIDKEIESIIISKNNVFYQKENGEDLFELFNDKKIFGKFFLARTLIFNDKIVFKGKNKNNEKVIYELDGFKIKESEINQLPDFVFNNKYYLCLSLKTVNVFDINNQIIWQQSFSDLLPSQETEEISISQEIIEISNVIYFTLNTNNQNICFGLDAQTGKVVKQFPNILGDLIQENEYIYFLYYNSITRLNTTNDTIEKWDIQDLLDKEDIGYLYFPRWAVLDGQIYFSQTKGSDIHSGKIGARFGVLDFNKRELIFKDQLDPKYGTIGSIKASKERLYLHTQDSTLHVFEKE